MDGGARQSRTSGDEAEGLLDHDIPTLARGNREHAARSRYARTEGRIESLRDRYDLDGRRKPNVLSRIWSTLCALLSVTGLLALIGLLSGYLVLHPQEHTFWPALADHDVPDTAVSHYPTDFTRDIVPLPCHSHNDYWRRVPFYDAVHAGCTSIEADVWAFGEALYVGHSIPSLSPNRTFESMYIDPIMEVLARMNPPTMRPYEEINGVFDEKPQQALVLLVDFKTEPEKTYLAVRQRLEPLRAKKYLTYFDGRKLVQGVVTVVGTGNTPFTLVEAETEYRDIFFDAPVAAFSGANQTEASKQYNSNNTYYASGSLYQTIGFPWTGKYTEKQLEKMRNHIQGVQKQGLKVRFWDTPAWPIGLRNYVWSLLVHEGVDVLNVDALAAATEQSWGKWG